MTFMRVPPVSEKKVDESRDKIGAFWSFPGPIHVGSDDLACHVSQNGKYVASFAKRWQICKVIRKNGKWRGAICKDGK
jgi:hypothetical protein